MSSGTDLIIHSDPKIMGGTPVFVGTRVPFQTLIDYIEGGDSIGEFLDDFPTVSREHVIAACELSAGHLRDIPRTLWRPPQRV